MGDDIISTSHQCPHYQSYVVFQNQLSRLMRYWPCVLFCIITSRVVCQCTKPSSITENIKLNYQTPLAIVIPNILYIHVCNFVILTSLHVCINRLAPTCVVNTPTLTKCYSSPGFIPLIKPPSPD